MTKRTLVQELREHSANAELNRNMLTAALTAQAADRIEELQNGFEGCCYACEPVGEMNKKLLKERDAALAVVNQFISDTTFKNQTPDHECEFKYSPETGKCDSCEAWGNYVGLFCSREDEEETLTDNLKQMQEERDDARWWAKEAIDALIEERDEARREVCEFEKYCLQEAAKRGWDCFKETK